MNKMLTWGIFIGLFGILFVPFITANGFFFPFITGKNFTFRIVVEIVFALWAILALKDVAYRPKKSALLYAVGAFVVTLGVSTLFAENPSKAFWSNFERMEGYITVLHLAGYFIVMTTMLQTEKLWKSFWSTSIGVSMALSLFGIGQIAGWFVINQGGVRVDATFGNATYLAVYMLFHVFLTLYMLAKWRWDKWVQVLFGIAIVLQASMVFFTATRGTILGLIGGLLVSGLIFAFLQKEHPLMRKVGIGLVVGVLVLSGGFFALRNSDFVRNDPVLTRIASISLSEGETRFTIWSMALKGFEERPIFGWGQEGFNYVFNKYYEPSLYGQEPWFDRAHNVFFDWLIAGGIFGLAAYLSFFAIALWYLWKPQSRFGIVERALFTGLLAGYAFHNMFVFDNLMSYVMFFAVLSYLAQWQTQEDTPLLSENTLSETWYQTGATAIALAMVVVFYMANVPGIARASGLIDAIKPYQAGVTKNFEAFKKVIGPSGLGRQEAHEQLLQFSSQIRSQQLSNLSSDDFKREVITYASEKFNEEINRTPNDARLILFYGSFLRQVGNREQARTMLERARALTPKKQTVLFELASLDLDEGNNESALDLLKQAFELDPAFDRARILYATMLLRTGATDKAEQLLIEGFGTATPNDATLLQAYSDIGDTEKVVAIAKARVDADSGNFQTHLQLAAAYLQAGDRPASVLSLREAIRLNPDFASQGEYYISEIEAGRNP